MIKKIGLMLLGLSVFFSYGQAQEIELGGFVGVNASSLVGKGLKEWTADGKAKIDYGLELGLRMMQPIGENWGFRHELGFGMLNSKLKMEEELVYNSQLRRYAINVSPINVFYKWNAVAVYGGPYLRFLTAASLQQIDEQGRKYRDKDIYGNAELEGDYMQKVDVGLKVGADLDLSSTWGVSMQFVRGFTPVMENAERKNQRRIYNQFGSLTLYYKFSRAN